MFPFNRSRNLFAPNPEPDNDPYSNIDFTPSADSTITSSPASSGDDQSSRLLDTYGKLAKMESGPASKAYRDFLATAPDQKDYQPSKTERLANMLSGVAVGFRHPEAGIATMDALNDDKFNKAQAAYKDKAGRMEKGAELEEKDINNRVKTYRDIEEFDRANKATQSLDNYRQGQLQIGRDKNKIAAGKPTGYYNDKSTGHRFAFTIGEGGTTNQYDLGKVGFTPEEEVTQETKKTKAAEDVKQPNRLALIGKRGEETRTNIQARLKASKSLVEFKQQFPTFQFKETSNGDITAFDPKDPTNVYDTGYKSSKLTDQEKADLGLKQKKELAADKAKTDKELEAEKQKNRVSLKQTAPPDKKVTVSGNTATTEYKRDNGGKIVPPPGYVRFKTKDGRGGIILKEDLAKHPNWTEDK